MVAALQLDAIVKRFDAFLALDAASFGLEWGEVHALLGENGAGKSSLMNIAAGLYRPDQGRMLVDGAECHFSGPLDAQSARIGMVHQHYKLVKKLTVAENLLLASPRRRFGPGLKDIAALMEAQASAIGFAVAPHARIDSLSIAEQQRVEILKALISGARILILDEPTAVLTDEEGEQMLGTVRKLAQGGAAVVLVTHKLHEVKRFADRVTIMRGGRTIATVDPATTGLAELAEMTVGPARPEAAKILLGERAVHAASSRLLRLSVKTLCCARADGHVAVPSASFRVYAGEIYGIAGVGGNGQTELVEALTGVRAPLQGEILLDGTGDIARLTPDRRRSLGIACIPADRQSLALAGSLSVVENYTIRRLHTGRYGPWWRVAARRMRQDAAEAIVQFDVQGVRRLDQKAAMLSGGNAQKLVIAREFADAPRVVIAHSPSRGLDIRACADIRRRLLEARAAGAAIVLVSDDLDEILSLSDRIGVMNQGRIAAEFAAPADRAAVGRAMVDQGSGATSPAEGRPTEPHLATLG